MCFINWGPLPPLCQTKVFPQLGAPPPLCKTFLYTSYSYWMSLWAFCHVFHELKVEHTLHKCKYLMICLTTQALHYILPPLFDQDANA